MATETARAELREYCERCGSETLHRVRVEIRAENAASSFSREPYRVRTCSACETTETTRMNDA